MPSSTVSTPAEASRVMPSDSEQVELHQNENRREADHQQYDDPPQRVDRGVKLALVEIARIVDLAHVALGHAVEDGVDHPQDGDAHRGGHDHHEKWLHHRRDRPREGHRQLQHRLRHQRHDEQRKRHAGAFGGGLEKGAP
ncbi:hypothetical protein [Marinovum sp. B10]|uniref:hypothetical protein n=1 Tax=Marinovum sp. B10 TaxID=3449224 RepID=UPI003EDC0B16